MYKTNFYFENSLIKMLSPFFHHSQLKICNCIWKASCVRSVLSLLYRQVLKRSRVFPDPAWLKIDNKQFRIFIYGFHFIPRVVASTSIWLFEIVYFTMKLSFEFKILKRCCWVLWRPWNYQPTSLKHRFKNGFYIMNSGINSDQSQT